MLEVKNVSKIYRTDDVELKALDGVSINLRRNEFVSILGPSGSGKTTLLNIIGGLDHYTSGDLIIDGVSTKEYKGRDWDAYRNHRVGFVFQSYNLIAHQSILANVELALTLSGVSPSERKKRAEEALKKVGLEQHLKKLPRQLSGGQMQRVAIARALVNNPSIILADEPTGALDSKTSVQIMELLKEIAKDKLVVMVTHNPELAKQYSTRIINVKDGKIIGDTKPFDGKNEEKDSEEINYTSMSLATALSLSKNNLMTKRGRTILTAIAGSIGIIGIALILALANGVNKYVGDIAGMGSIPSAITVDRTYLESGDLSSMGKVKTDDSQANGDVVAEDDIKNNLAVSKQSQIRFNDTKSLKKYIDENKAEVEKFTDTVAYDYDVKINVFDKDKNGQVIRVNPFEDQNDLASILSSDSKNVEVKLSDFLKSSMKEMVSETPYEVVSGRFAKEANELVLVVNDKNKINLSKAYTLNLADRTKLDSFVYNINHGGELVSGNVGFNYNDIVGKTYRVSLNGESYDDGYEVKIVGVIKTKKDADESDFIAYTHKLTEKVMAATGQDNSTPDRISFYAKTEDDKKKVNSFLDKFNEGREEKIKYTDSTMEMIKTVKTAVNMLSYVLIAFVAISLVVSSIMIGIITYISVLERTKEIGILRAIGASKRDVVRVFRAETIIEGFVAGLLGVVTSWILCLGVNFIVSITAKIDNIARMDLFQAIILILISIALTVFAGSVPAKKASKKDPVEALRSE